MERASHIYDLYMRNNILIRFQSPVTKTTNQADVNMVFGDGMGAKFCEEAEESIRRRINGGSGMLIHISDFNSLMDDYIKKTFF